MSCDHARARITSIASPTRWCPDCGALGIRNLGDSEFQWTLPKVAKRFNVSSEVRRFEIDPEVKEKEA